MIGFEDTQHQSMCVCVWEGGTEEVRESSSGARRGDREAEEAMG